MIRLSVLVPCWNQEELVIRLLDSIPRCDGIEVIAWDDGSGDKTYENLCAYRDGHPELSLSVYRNVDNKGCAYTCNRLLEASKGEYIHYMGNDDYLITDEYIKAMEYIGKADVVCFNLRINNGDVWPVNESTHHIYCAQTVRFIRREITDGIVFPEHIRGASDWYFNLDLMKRNPTMLFTGITAYHYNFPREGSLCDLIAKGIIVD